MSAAADGRLWGASLPPADSTATPARPVPGRHGADRDRARALAARLRLTIDGDPEPSEQDWAVLGCALNRGDALADAVIAWMRKLGRAEAWPLMERGLHGGPDAVPMRLRHSRPSWCRAGRCRAGSIGSA